ncbi:MAG: hypothetical protein HC782_03625 [Gammaproteobacteria bacterium]|nr:hypothetical protein [Gammaproteobacteria bacterium]
MNTLKHLRSIAAAALLGFVTLSGAAFAQVAVLLELQGTATAQVATAEGAPAAPLRNLRKGDGVNQGETIRHRRHV